MTEQQFKNATAIKETLSRIEMNLDLLSKSEKIGGFYVDISAVGYKDMEMLKAGYKDILLQRKNSLEKDYAAL
jgi:hypothetical protein